MENPIFITDDLISSKIFFIRGLKVMLDEDLAGLYGVPTKRLNEQVNRNRDRFPSDFMFQLSDTEFQILGGAQKVTKCLHRTRGTNVIQCFKQQTGYPDKYSDHAHFYKNPGNV